MNGSRRNSIQRPNDLNAFGHESFVSTTSDDFFDEEECTYVPQPEDDVKPLARRETQYVQGSKALVFVVLLLGTTLTAWAAYVYSRRHESSVFRAEFRECASELIAQSQLTAQTLVRSVSALGNGITASTDPKSWPFVTIANFGPQAVPILENSIDMLSFHPLVPNRQRNQWESFVSDDASREWITESVLYGGGTISDWVSLGVPSVIRRTAEDDKDMTMEQLMETSSSTSTSPSLVPEDRAAYQYAPLWQLAPLENRSMLNLINFNLLDLKDVSSVLSAAEASQGAALTKVLNLGSGEGPQSLWVVPVFDRARPRAVKSENGNVSNYQITNDEEDKDGLTTDATVGNHTLPIPNLVAILSAVVPWQSHFKFNAHETVAMNVVVRNTCGQIFTFLIDANDLQYQGPSDAHDRNYEDLVVKGEFARLPYASPDSYCQYTLEVYPTAKFEKSFETSNPWIYMGAVIVVFASISVVFLVYDCFVQKRNRAVMKSANQSNAIVASLFPSTVRDQLMADAKEPGGKKRRRRKRPTTASTVSTTGLDDIEDPISPANKRQRSFRRRPSTGSIDSTSTTNVPAEELSSVLLSSKPIASHYPLATVLFADIAGFTAWSSEREAVQVFTLLEQIYSNFDAIAKRRGVFKVETIGDCYMAVTGLPQPRDDHAEVMCRFANECLNRFPQVLASLETLLGSDTLSLAMRFGIHSGPVTAGVLRGEKSRFQLFGDTVNTASRMESTGQKDRVQLSEETAALVVGAGKLHWVAPREDKVTAKGKGLLNTYWLLTQTPPTAPDTGHIPDDCQSLPSVNPLRRTNSASQNSLASPHLRTPTTPRKALRKSMSGGTAPSPLRLTETTTKSKNNTSQSSLPVEPPGYSADSIEKSKRNNPKSLGRMGRTDSILSMDSSMPSSMRSRKSRKISRSTRTGLGESADKLMTDGNMSKLSLDDVPKDERAKYVIDQSMEILEEHLQMVLAVQAATPLLDDSTDWDSIRFRPMSSSSKTVLDELRKPILPSPLGTMDWTKLKPVHLNPLARAQLQNLVESISSQYHNSNAFHNFEHAVHVTLNLHKLLVKLTSVQKGKSQYIQIDPLMQFSCVLASLIHDVDHEGVSNAQLIREGKVAAGSASAAEQRSIEVAWKLLRRSKYRELRASIYRTQAEFDRFRQVVVRVVLSTDLFDQTRAPHRQERWETVMRADSVSPSLVPERSMLVLEHLMQASDLSHSMQDWRTFKKWNRRLFVEQHQAHCAGRTQDGEQHPSERWYWNEFGFFDSFVVPLAMQLQRCGLGDGFERGARLNRDEWKRKGKRLVSEKYLSSATSVTSSH